jgi:hypothetical protein
VLEEKGGRLRLSSSPAAPVANGSGVYESPNGHTTTTPSAPRTLSKNPNGTYTYRGAGSARPRARYSSPGFGSARKQPANINLPSPSKTPLTSKRQRTDTKSNGQNAIPFPVTSPQPEKPVAPEPSTSATTTSTANSKPAANSREVPPITPRPVRLLSPQPVNPSPLRQAWSAVPSSPSSTESSPSAPVPARASISAVKPTRAAETMSQLIKDVTPRKPNEAIVNPYESLVPKQPRAKAQPRRRSMAPQTATAAPPPQPKKDDKEDKENEEQAPLSAQTIIEATVPKGSKRARPPPEIASKPVAKPASPPLASEPRRSARIRSRSPEPEQSRGITQILEQPKKPSVVIEEVEEEEESPTKKRKGGLPSRNADVIIEEIEVPAPKAATKPAEVVEPSSAAQQTTSATTSATRETSPDKSSASSRFARSAPKEPSKLRYSIAPEDQEERKDERAPSPMAEDDAKPAFAFAAVPKPAPTFASAPAPAQAPASAPAPAPAPLEPAFTIKPDTNTGSRKAEKTPKDMKAAALAIPRAELPTYDFTLPKVGESSKSVTAMAVISVAAVDLPTYDFTAPALGDKGKGKAPAAPSGGLNWGAAGMNASSAFAPFADVWTCDTCMLKNPASVKDKCSVCDAPRPGAAAGAAACAPATSGFNWSAAGMKPPTTSASGGEWACDTCGLKNPASAAEKCTICDAPKPGGATPTPAAAPTMPVPPAAPFVGFNWAAAGMRAPTAAGAAEWTCGTCGLKNPASATEKCTICDASR